MSANKLHKSSILLFTLLFLCNSVIVTNCCYINDDEPYKLHMDSVVVDTHSDTPLRILNLKTWLPENDIGRSTANQVDLPKLKAGGVDAETFAAYTAGFLNNGKFDYIKSNSRLLSLINGLKWAISNNPSSIEQAFYPEDITRIVKSGRIAAISSIEGAYSLERDTGIELLRQYYDLGVRLLALNWSISNVLGEGNNEAYKDGTPSSGGLTELGEAVIGEMNRLGMVVDVSHMNKETFWGALAASKAPVIASHSGAAGLNKHMRNLDDDQIKAIAANGGVVQIVFYPLFLDGSPDIKSVKIIDILVDHIDYVVRLAGIDHVGLGSDFDGAHMGTDLADASMMPNITRELLERDYSSNDIKKILGGNTLRVFEEAMAKAPAAESIAAPEIKPDFAMGQMIYTDCPILAARITTQDTCIDTESLKIIVDGRVYKPLYRKENGLMSIKLAKPLRERFHVVSFEAADISGNISREARIFCIR